MKPWLFLAVGIVACSTAVIFIKASHTPPVWLAAERLLLAAAVLAPLAWRDAKRNGDWRWADLKTSLWPGLFLAIHFATWVVAARLIPAANSMLIANFTPVVMPVVALLLLKERISPRDLAATVIGVGGVAAMAVGDLQIAGSYMMGNVLCFLAMVALALYLALAKRLRRGSLWLYIVPIYAIAGVLCSIAALVVDGVPPLPQGRELALIVALALLPTVIGHTLMNRAMGELRPQVVSIAGLGGVPCAAFVAWLLWREVPTPWFWVTCAAYVVSLVLLMAPALRAQAKPAA